MQPLHRWAPSTSSPSARTHTFGSAVHAAQLGCRTLALPVDSRSQRGPVTCVICMFGRHGMIVHGVVALAVPDLPPTGEPAGVAQPLVGVQRHRTFSAASRRRRATQSSPEAPPELGGRAVFAALVRTLPTMLRGICWLRGHDPALAPSPGHQEIDISASRRRPPVDDAVAMLIERTARENSSWG
jgi:hypothetical protein